MGRPGIVIFEINGITETIARQAIKIASSKLPIKTKFVRKLFDSKCLNLSSKLKISIRFYVFPFLIP